MSTERTIFGDGRRMSLYICTLYLREKRPIFPLLGGSIATRNYAEMWRGRGDEEIMCKRWMDQMETTDGR